MISPHCVNFLNLVTESRSLVNKQLNEIMRRRFPREELKLFVDSSTPCDNNTGSNLEYKSHSVDESPLVPGQSHTIMAPIGSRSRNYAKMLDVPLTKEGSHAHHLNLLPPADMRIPGEIPAR